MNYYHFIGLDLGKLSFDATILKKDGTQLSHSQFENTPKGMIKFMKWVRSFKVVLSRTLFCAENMGTYASHLCLYCSQKELHLSLACPLTIKRSMGITRGKNDKIDSFRIAEFALSHSRKLKPYSLPDKVLRNLKGWIILREQVVKQKSALDKILKGFEYEKKITETPKLISYTQKKISRLEKEIKELEVQMAAAIESNESINDNYKLLISVVGVGRIIASALLCSTGNFKKFETHRQFACYCGTAPFEYTSGISIKGKTKVSSIGNKKLKALLTTSAISAVRYDHQLSAYYKRKTDQGKHKASVLNAVKCKIIARCFAVIKRDAPYVNLTLS